MTLDEIVPGKITSKKTVGISKKFYTSLSMLPLILKKELPGYLSDRLQEALWREALHIINEGYATTDDLDKTLSYYDWKPYKYNETSSDWENDNSLIEKCFLNKQIFPGVCLSDPLSKSGAQIMQ